MRFALIMWVLGFDVVVRGEDADQPLIDLPEPSVWAPIEKIKGTAHARSWLLAARESMLCVQSRYGSP